MTFSPKKEKVNFITDNINIKGKEIKYPFKNQLENSLDSIWKAPIRNKQDSNMTIYQVATLKKLPNVQIVD